MTKVSPCCSNPAPSGRHSCYLAPTRLTGQATANVEGATIFAVFPDLALLPDTNPHPNPSEAGNLRRPLTRKPSAIPFYPLTIDQRVRRKNTLLPGTIQISPPTAKK